MGKRGWEVAVKPTPKEGPKVRQVVVKEIHHAVAVKPTPKEGPKAVRPGERTVVLRPVHFKEPTAEGRQAPIEKILVGLVLEADRVALMDASEAQGVVSEISSRHLVQLAAIQRYAEFRGVKMVSLDEINQRYISKESGGS